MTTDKWWTRMGGSPRFRDWHDHRIGHQRPYLPSERLPHVGAERLADGHWEYAPQPSSINAIRPVREENLGLADKVCAD